MSDSLNLEQRIRRLTDFDVAGLGGETWNRLLDGFAGVRHVVEAWESTFTLARLDWFSAEGHRAMASLDERSRTTFRGTQEEVRGALFDRYAHALEPPRDPITEALARPVISGYSRSVLGLLVRQQAVDEARAAVARLDADRAARSLRPYPALLAAWHARTSALDPVGKPTATLRQVRIADGLVAHGRTLAARRQELSKRIEELWKQWQGSHAQREGYTASWPDEVRSAPLPQQMKILHAAIRRESAASQLSALEDRNLPQQVVQAMGVQDAAVDTRLLRALADTLKKNGR